MEENQALKDRVKELETGIQNIYEILDNPEERAKAWDNLKKQ